MIEDIIFESKPNGVTEIKLQHSGGEETVLGFNSPFPMQTKEYYVKAIDKLVNKKPNLSVNDDLQTIFTSYFLKCRLITPLYVFSFSNDERTRIGNRIKELREEANIDAKTLASRAGIDAANLCRIERGKYSVGLDILSKIASVLGYEIEFVKKNK